MTLMWLFIIRENQQYRSYNKLVTWCPSVRTFMQSSAECSEVAAMCNKVKDYATIARLLTHIL